MSITISSVAAKTGRCVPYSLALQVAPAGSVPCRTGRTTRATACDGVRVVCEGDEICPRYSARFAPSQLRKLAPRCHPAECFVTPPERTTTLHGPQIAGGSGASVTKDHARRLESLPSQIPHRDSRLQHNILYYAASVGPFMPARLFPCECHGDGRGQLPNAGAGNGSHENYGTAKDGDFAASG